MKVVAPASRRELDAVEDDHRRSEEELDDDRARRFTDLVLPELFAALLPRTRPNAPFQLASTLVPSKRYEATQGAAEGWRTAVGDLTASTFGDRAAAARSATGLGAGAGNGVEGRLITHLEAGEMGRIRLVIERTDQGLKVSLGVENAVLAALAMSQRSVLEQSLRASGLQVAAVLVTHAGADGTVLAQPTIVNRRGAIDVTDEGGPADGKTRGRDDRSNKRLNVTG
jgi:hypothetical protein